jgi:glyoxylase-like metal-dependent hydrolase (beta-lactamase superfamily II)
MVYGAGGRYSDNSPRGRRMELYNNVHQIQSLFGGRNLFQYLFVSDKTVLIDTGIAETPEKSIFPYLDKLTIKPQQLAMVITTHTDLDHQGGNAAIKQASRRTLLACGEADRAMVEDPCTLYELRYNHLRKDHDVGFEPQTSPDAGRACKIDIGFSGGERIGLGGEWSLEVLHVPGHFRGHLALYDPKHKAAFVSDAIHGRGCPKADGSMGIPVTYFYVDIYLSTLPFPRRAPDGGALFGALAHNAR